MSVLTTTTLVRRYIHKLHGYDPLPHDDDVHNNVQDAHVPDEHVAIESDSGSLLTLGLGCRRLEFRGLRCRVWVPNSDKYSNALRSAVDHLVTLSLRSYRFGAGAFN